MNDHLLNIFSESGCPPHETLVAYFRNRLPEEERHLVEQHLVDCAMCSDELEGLSLMRDPGELDRIVEGIGTALEERRGRILHFNRRVLLMAAAAVIVFLVGSAVVIRLLVPGREQPGMSVSIEVPAVKDLTETVPPPASPASPEKSQPIKTKTLSSVSSHPASVPDTQTISTEPLTVAGVALPVEVDSQVVSEIVAEESPEPVMTREVNKVAPEEKQAIQRKDAAAKSQPLSFAASPGKTDTISAALDLFYKADYRKALQLFTSVLGSQPGNYKALYYSADCYYHLKETRNAERALEPILKSPGNEFYRRALKLSEKIREQERDSIRPDSLKQD